MTSHGIQDGQKLAHAGGERYLRGLAGGQQALVEGADDRVEAGGNQGALVERLPHSRPTAPDHAFTPVSAAVPIQGGDADEGGDLFAPQGAELRQAGQKGCREHGPYSLDAPKEFILLSPNRSLANGVGQALVDVGQASLQPADVLPDTGANR